jgi:hypothetical protein
LAGNSGQFVPGDPRRWSSGRPKGSSNHSTTELRKKAQELGCDPFEILCRFAMGDAKALGYRPLGKDTDGKDIYPAIDPKLRKSAAADASQYIYHKLKSVEITGPVGGMIDQYLTMPDDERKRRLAALSAALFGSATKTEPPKQDEPPPSSDEPAPDAG